MVAGRKHKKITKRGSGGLARRDGWFHARWNCAEECKLSRVERRLAGCFAESRPRQKASNVLERSSNRQNFAELGHDLKMSSVCLDNRQRPDEYCTMHKRSSSTDVNKMAARVIDGMIEKENSGGARKPKNRAAVALGRLGGKKGGPARAAKLSSSRRREIAQYAANTRWRNSAS